MTIQQENTQAYIDTLRRERDAYLNDLRISNDTGHTWANRALELSNQVERQAERIAALEEALRPFAAHDWSFSSAPDEALLSIPGLVSEITLGDLKRARGVLRGEAA